MGIKLRELHEVLAILERLAQLLDPRLGTIHPVDSLHDTNTKYIQDKEMRCSFQDHHGKILDDSHAEYQKLKNTLMLSALFSISDVHFRMMKGTPSGLFLAACVKSMPKRWSLP